MFVCVCVCVEANVSLQLMVDPLRPRAIPGCAFLGPDQGKRLILRVAIQSMVCKVCAIWSAECVRYGLQSVCDMVCKVCAIWSAECV